jgi:CHAT domain-containing protein
VLAAEQGLHLAEVILPRQARELVSRLSPRGVIIVPDGALHQLPFEALLLSNQPRPRYLLDVFPPINYAPSVAILMNLQQRARQIHDTPPSVLTVGDPQYAQRVDVAQTRGVAKVSRAAFLGLGGDLAALPGTAAECRRVAKAFSSLPVTLLSGPDATEDNVRKHIGGRRFVHLAAHGLVDQQYDNCFGAIALTPPQARGNLAENDGFLELREIQTLPLSDCELAVLSACQTVVGPNRPQEAGSSLAQAFLIAGARRVICSHWNVDDASTSEMMGIFFEHVAGMLERGERIDYAAALRAAQETLRAKSDHASPYYWAPFVLVGPAT